MDERKETDDSPGKSQKFKKEAILSKGALSVGHTEELFGKWTTSLFVFRSSSTHRV
jgi:hypothetical protein